MSIIDPHIKSVNKAMSESAQQSWPALTKSIIRGIFEIVFVGALFWIIRHL